jgi:hypothetical protein
VGVSQRHGCGLLDRGPGFEPAMRAGEFGIECFDCGDAGFDAVLAGGAVAGSRRSR